MNIYYALPGAISNIGVHFLGRSFQKNSVTTWTPLPPFRTTNCVILKCLLLTIFGDVILYPPSFRQGPNFLCLALQTPEQLNRWPHHSLSRYENNKKLRLLWKLWRKNVQMGLFEAMLGKECWHAVSNIGKIFEIFKVGVFYEWDFRSNRCMRTLLYKHGVN